MNENLTTAMVPSDCTLPTSEQPLRVDEFDELFSRHVTGVDGSTPGRVVLNLDPTPEVASRVAHLAARETGCCGFFTFSLELSDGNVALTVTVDEGHRGVLDAVAARARDLSGGPT